MRILLIILAVLSFTTLKSQHRIVVNNPTSEQLHAVVEIDSIEDLGNLFVVRNAFGIEQPWQVTYEGKLLLYVSVRPHGEAVYTISSGEPMPMKQYAFGKYYPERADDISFENDRAGFRIYGPETQKRGEKAFGIDLWVKHSSELLVDSLYRLEFSKHQEIAELRKNGQTEEAEHLTIETSYHLDHGAGMDGYGVGPTLGCGTPALMLGDSICYPWCYENYKILDNGPLRFTLQLDFQEKEIDGMTVREHRLMTLDRGSNFCKVTVWYDGIDRPLSLATGFAIRTADTTSVVLGDNYIHYADPTIDPERYNSQIYVALLFPDKVDVICTKPFTTPVGANYGHGLGILAGYTGYPYTYYIGMAWSDLDVRSHAEWHERVVKSISELKSSNSI